MCTRRCSLLSSRVRFIVPSFYYARNSDDNLVTRCNVEDIIAIFALIVSYLISAIRVVDN